MDDFETFMEQVESRIRERIDGAETEIFDIYKNNGIKYRVLSIREEDSRIAPCIDLGSIQEAYASGNISVDDVADWLICACRAKKDILPFGLEVPSDWDKVRFLLQMHVVNTEKNREILEGMPHRDFLDLSIVYRISFVIGGETQADMMVYDGFMEMWDVTEADLYDAAQANAGDADLLTMKNFLLEIGGLVEEDVKVEDHKMYILTNGQRKYGAVYILDRHALERAAEEIGGDFFILPSSIHELVLYPVPEGDGDGYAGFLEMVREINDTVVAEEEILSYHVYRYRNGAISIAG